MLPYFTLGEPKRNYQFTWVLVPPVLSSITTIISQLRSKQALSVLKNSIKLLSNTTTALYVSQLAKNVALPPAKLKTDVVNLGSVEFPIPVSRELAPFTVTYLDDSIETVYKYHMSWYEMVAIPGSPNLMPLASAAFSAIYSPYSNFIPALIPGYHSTILSAPVGASQASAIGSAALQALAETPTSIETYPGIFPVEIKRDDADKTGKGFGTVKVTYIRVPKLIDGTDFVSALKSVFGL